MARQTVLVTGANKGIGFEIARQLGSKGFHVILSGKSAERVENAVRKLEGDGISVQSLIMDVSNPSSVHAAFRQIAQKTAAIDVLINNAGILLDENTPLLKVPAEDLIKTFSVNAFGAFYTVQAFLPLLKKDSRIINVSSGGGQILNGVSTWSPVYCMSKTTLNALTMQLAEALRSSHIAVNAICPGWVRTDMGGMGASRSAGKGAETAVWLATEAAQNITGKFFRDKKEIDW